MPPLLADFIHARGCKPICEKSLTLPHFQQRPAALYSRLAPASGIRLRGPYPGSFLYLKNMCLYAENIKK